MIDGLGARRDVLAESNRIRSAREAKELMTTREIEKIRRTISETLQSSDHKSGQAFGEENGPTPDHGEKATSDRYDWQGRKALLTGGDSEWRAAADGIRALKALM